MLPSDRGFLAMTDAVIFIVVIMMAAAVTVGCMEHTAGGEEDVPGFLEDLLSSEVRMSDLTDGDDSMVRLSDMIALGMMNEDERILAYTEDLLSSFSKGRGCILTLEYEHDGKTVSETLGSGDGEESAESSKTVPVSTGGTLSAKLTVFS